MTIYIYGLECPVEGMIRYVGKSTKPDVRLRAHISGAHRGAYDHHTARWIRRLLSDGLRPTLVILHEVQDGERWQDIERAFIATAPERGWRLTNSTAGGEGLDYLDPEDDARYRANLKRAMTAYNATPAGQERFRKMIAATLEPEALARRNAAIRAAKDTPEFRAKMAIVGREIGSRPEVKAAKSAASTGHWQRTEYREAITAARNDPKFTDAQSARLKSRWADPDNGPKLRAIHASEEVRRKKSEAAKRRSTPEYRAMMAEKTRASWEARRNRS